MKKTNFILAAICSLQFAFILSGQGQTDWVVGANGDAWVGNVTFDSTYIKYENVELLNGWNPSNVVHIQSGGSNNYLKSPNQKQAIRVTPSVSKTVTSIATLPCCYIPLGTGTVWRIGIQADNNGQPSGTYLGSGTYTVDADEEWVNPDITPSINLTQGVTYWIVIQYDSGCIPTETSCFTGIYASDPSEDFMYDNNPLGYNQGYDKSVNDKGTMSSSCYNGVSWGPCTPWPRNLPVFVLNFNDGTYIGNAYKHNYDVDFWGVRYGGQKFVNYSSDKTVDKLSFPLNAYYGTPADDLYCYIRANTWTGTILYSGVFLRKEDVACCGAGVRKWYTANLSTPVTFLKDSTYVFYFTSPGSSWPNGYYASDAANTFGAYPNTTYNKQASYYQETQTGDWTDNRIYIDRDYSFRFHLVNVFNGNITSITKDAESLCASGNVWKQIRFDGLVPSGTKVSIAVNSTTCGNFVIVKDSAVSGVTYNIPSCAQERYASWKLTLHTDDPSITPEIYKVIFICDAPTGIIENETINNITIYPNPAQGKTQIEINLAKKENVQISIYNILGEEIGVVANSEMNAGKHKLDISDYLSKAGVYIIQVKTGNTMRNMKLLNLK